MASQCKRIHTGYSHSVTNFLSPMSHMIFNVLKYIQSIYEMINIVQVCFVILKLNYCHRFHRLLIFSFFFLDWHDVIAMTLNQGLSNLFRTCPLFAIKNYGLPSISFLNVWISLLNSFILVTWYLYVQTHFRYEVYLVKTFDSISRYDTLGD